ncbi:unnamed protein product [Prunus armeniaca]|uniref:Uncharacterized protein n=1 Tax=Prunus armeniaca TaxID=36596 RepID=A0A6J5XAD6_PRUAR|nr:unnamed protein product [Prunus armeniaca]
MLGNVVPVNMMFIDMVLVDTAVEPGQNGTGESQVNLGGRWGRAHLVATLGGEEILGLSQREEGMGALSKYLVEKGPNLAKR